jgi:hypothetical protein
MRDLAMLVIHLISTVAKLLLPGGTRFIVSESVDRRHPPPALATIDIYCRVPQPRNKK